MGSGSAIGERVRRALPGAFEWLVFLVGAALRLRLHESYDPEWSYDAKPHLEYIDYIVAHHALPPLEAQREACHPPLYYVLAAGIRERGGDLFDLQLISIGAGIATLALIWIGARRVFPKDRPARLMALALAAVLPCAIHVQGMVTNEALDAMFATATLLMVEPALTAGGVRRLVACAALASSYAAALLTKISPIVFVFAIGLGIAVEVLAKRRAGWRAALRRQLLPAGALVVGLAVALPVAMRHYPSTGLVFPNGYDILPVKRVDDVPLWKRRPVAFYVAPCAREIVTAPYYPTCSRPEARFWPVLLATTFVDYYDYRYAGMAPGDDAVVIANGKELSLTAVGFMRVAVVAGAAIACAAVAGVVAGLARALRRRDGATVAVLSAAVMAIAVQLLYAVRWPYDGFGPIKGTYVQFGAGPLFLAFGGACSWLMRRRLARPVALVQVAAVAALAAYSIYARWHGFYD